MNCLSKDCRCLCSFPHQGKTVYRLRGPRKAAKKAPGPINPLLVHWPILRYGASDGDSDQRLQVDAPRRRFVRRLENYVTAKPGDVVIVGDVSSEEGNRVSPNDQRYKIRRISGSYLTYSYNVLVQGDVIRVSSFDSNFSANGVVTNDHTQFVVSGTPNQSPDWDRLKERNLEKIFAQLRGNSEILVDLAESGQTVKMLRQTLRLKREILKFLGELATKPKKVRRAITHGSGKWLEYRYGWIPLMGSIYEAGENLRRQIHNRRFGVRVRSTYEAGFPRSYRAGTPGSQTYQQMTGHVKQSVWHQYGMNFRMPSPNVQQMLNWSSLNPATIAWELVPLSFVIDWFVNIGDSLRAWENHVIFSSLFEGGYETRTIKEVRHAWWVSGTPRLTPDYWPDGQSIQGYYGSSESHSARCDYRDKQRVKLLSLPTPVGLRVRCNLNSSRFVDAASLTSKHWKRFV
jgi:hypothetical protein